MSDPSPITDLKIAQRTIEQLTDELLRSTAEAATVREDMRSRMQEFAREFRAPLATVLGFSDLLSARDKSHTVEWNQIAIAGHQLMELIKELEQPLFAGNPTSELQQPTVSEPAPQTARTILHIEDNETNFRLTEQILTDRPNINVIWAPDGTRGVESAIKNAPALILLDMNLPDIHGSEVLAKLRSNPATEKIPVIVLSADASPTQIEKMLQTGARDYLLKPFEIKEFLCTVDEALRGATKVAV